MFETVREVIAMVGIVALLLFFVCAPIAIWFKLQEIVDVLVERNDLIRSGEEERVVGEE